MPEGRSLAGRRVLVARPAAQGVASAAVLRAAGAEPVLVPLIELTPPTDGGAALRGAVQHLATYDWLVLTSANGAVRLLEALGDRRVPSRLRVAAIGPATADALAAAGVRVALLPDRYVAEGLLEAFPPPGGGDVEGRVLVVRAAVARDVLPDGLPSHGLVRRRRGRVPGAAPNAGGHRARRDRHLRHRDLHVPFGRRRRSAISPSPSRCHRRSPQSDP